jgi:hypothetical protein
MYVTNTKALQRRSENEEKSFIGSATVICLQNCIEKNLKNDSPKYVKQRRMKIK